LGLEAIKMHPAGWIETICYQPRACFYLNNKFEMMNVNRFIFNQSISLFLSIKQLKF